MFSIIFYWKIIYRRKSNCISNFQLKYLVKTRVFFFREAIGPIHIQHQTIKIVSIIWVNTYEMFKNWHNFQKGQTKIQKWLNQQENPVSGSYYNSCCPKTNGCSLGIEVLFGHLNQLPSTLPTDAAPPAEFWSSLFFVPSIRELKIKYSLIQLGEQSTVFDIYLLFLHKMWPAFIAQPSLTLNQPAVKSQPYYCWSWGMC